MGYADGVQELVRGGVRGDAVENFDVTLAVFALGVGADVRHLEVGELNAFEGVAVSLFTVAQVTHPVGVAQDGFHAGGVLYTGGNIGTVPYAVFLSVGEVVFVDVNGAGAVHVDGGVLHGGCGGSYREAEQSRKAEQQTDRFFDGFHVVCPFRMNLSMKKAHGRFHVRTERRRGVIQFVSFPGRGEERR